MSENGSVYGIAVFLLILNIVSPIFVYALTDFSMNQDYSRELQYLDEEDLIASGIMIDADERHLLTYEGTPDYVTFTANLSKAMRVRWYDGGGSLNGLFDFYGKLYGELNDWWVTKDWFPAIINGETFAFHFVPLGEENYCLNATIINAYSTRYNWTHVKIQEIGVHIFFTCEKYSDNMTLAINAGELNVTLGKPINYLDFTPLEFVGWYWGLVSGSDYYDMPVYISWIFRLQAVLLVFAGTIIVRDLLPL